jgi:hypothetical protein
MRSKLPFLTPEQDAEFDRLVRVWQERLNLTDWRIERGVGRCNGSMAKVKLYYPDRLAAYKTGNWSGPTTSEAIEATVVHELLHVLLFELTYSVASDASSQVQYSVEHRVVNTLEKLLMRRA